MGAGRKKETFTLVENNFWSNTTSNSSVPTRKLSKKNLAGVIFGCTHETMSECLEKKLFGLPYGHFSYVQNITPGLPLFLFNYVDRKLHGIYEASTYGQLYINSSAWINDDMGKTPFPAQVSMRVKTQCQPLKEKQYMSLLKKNYHKAHHFYFELDHEQTKGLIALFKPCPNVRFPHTARKLPKIPDSASVMPSQTDNIPQPPGAKWTDVVKHRRSEVQETTSEPPEAKWTDVVKHGRLEVQETTSEPVGMLSKEEIFPALPSTKKKEVVQWQVVAGCEKIVEGVASPTSSVNENKSVFVPSNDGGSIESQSGSLPRACEDTESDETATDWEDLAEDDLQIFASDGREELEQRDRRQIDQKQQSDSEKPKSQEQKRVLHRLEKLLADRRNLASSSKCYIDDGNFPDSSKEWDTQNHCAHILDEPNVSAKKQNILNAFDLNNRFTAGGETSNASYMDLGVSELVQIIKELQERAENLENQQVQADREVLQLKDIVRDAEDRNQLLKDRVEELESKLEYSLTLNDGSGDKLVEQFLGSDDVMYLIGGFDGCTFLSSLDCFSPSLDILTPLKPMRSALIHASSAAVDGLLYVFGGSSNNSASNRVECYNKRYDEWMTCASMLCNKGNLAGATSNGKIYAVGGGDRSNCFSNVEMYDPAVDRCIPNHLMIHKRFSLAAAELKGSIYALGGYDGKTYLRSTERFDPREGYWSLLPNMNTRRGSHSVAVLNDKIYCIGGFDGDRMVSTVEIYEPRLNAWVMWEPMKLARGYAAASVIGNSIFVIGGLTEEKSVVDKVEYYKEGVGWTTGGWNSIGKRSFSSGIVF